MTYSATTSIPGVQITVRPDEIIFHRGVCWDKSAPWTGLGAYTADIFQDGVKVTTISVPNHPWNADWVYEINPDTVINSPATILKNGWILPYGQNGLMPAKPPNKFAGPMSPAGITTTEGNTGERPDIGWLADPSAFFLISGDAGPMIAAAQGIRACCMFMRDEKTGRPVDKLAIPNANDYPSNAQGGTWIDPAYVAGAFSWDVGHNPETSYVAFLATLKMRHLEVVQYNASKGLLFDINKLKLAGFPILPEGQTRGLAWCLRNLAQAWKATQIAESLGPLPSYLFPSSYWKKHLDNELAWLTKSYMNDPAIQVHRFFPYTGGPSPWQQEMVTFTLLHLAYWLPGEWSAFLLWSLGNLMPRLSVARGGYPAFPNSYRYKTGPLFVPNVATQQLSTKATDHWPTWKALFDDYLSVLPVGTTPPAFEQTGYNGVTAAMVAKLQADPYYGGSYMTPDFYCYYIHTCLAWAVFLDRSGVVNISGTWPELEPVFAEQDAMLKKWVATRNPPSFPARQSALVAPMAIPAPAPAPAPTPQPAPTPVPATKLQTLIAAIKAAIAIAEGP